MSTPTREASTRGVLVAVLLLMFCVSTGYFMVAPLLALDLTVSLHMAVAAAGVLVGLYVFLSQAMQTVAGVLISRYGTLPVLLSSAAVALAGYLSLAVARSTVWATIAIGLAAIGNGGRTVSMKTLLTSVWQRQGVRALTMRSLVVNVAAAIGPLLGVLLLRHFVVALVTAGLVNVPLVAFAVRLRHQLRRPPGTVVASWRNLFAGIGALLRHPLLRNAMAGSIGFWLLYAQISLTVPLYVHQAYHSAFLLSAMFVLNAVLAAVVQATMLKGLGTQPNVSGLLAVGLFVTGCSFLPLALHLHGAEVFAFAVIFTFGEAITVPMLDAAAGVAADWSISAGSAFGLMAMGWAIGGLIGNDLGGLAFSVAEQHQQLRLLWMCFFLVGCGSAAVMMRRAAHRQSRRGET
jgi:MFS transporter, DHA1 family, multidrug resistance protein